MNFKEALIALETTLQTAASGTTVQYSHTPYTPGNNAWIRGTLLPQTGDFFLSKNALWEGVYQIDIYYPIGSSNKSALYDKAQAVQTAFTGLTKYSTGGSSLRVTDIQRRESDEDAWSIISLDVGWNFSD